MNKSFYDECDNFEDMVEFPDGKITLLGSSTTWDHSGDVQCESHGHTRADVWLVGLIDTTVVGMDEQPEESIKLKVYPNPAGDYIHFNLIGSTPFCETKITIFNVLGQFIDEIIFPAGQQEVTFPIAHLAAGIYSYVLTNQQLIKSGKMLITR